MTGVFLRDRRGQDHEERPREDGAEIKVRQLEAKEHLSHENLER